MTHTLVSASDTPSEDIKVWRCSCGSMGRAVRRTEGEDLITTAIQLHTIHANRAVRRSTGEYFS